MASQQIRILISVVTRIAVSIVLLVIAFGIFGFLVTSRPKAEVAEHVDIAPRVQVMELQPVQVKRVWRGYGSAQAMDSTNIPSRVSAIVVERPAGIRAGAPVSAGQLLVKLDESDFIRQVEISTQAIADMRAQLAQLDVEEASWKQRAALLAEETAFAKAEYERAAQALERSAAKQREVDLAGQAYAAAQRSEVAAREEVLKVPARRARLEALLAQQESSLKLAQQNQERCTITSPFAGVLQSVDVEVGESVTPGQRVARVVSLASIEVPVRLPAAARHQLAPGDLVTLRATSDAGLVWQARLSRIAPEDDEASRTLTVFAELSQEQQSGGMLLAPGRFVEAEVASGTAQQHLIVPRRALTSERVAVVENGLVRTVPIRVLFHLDQTFPATGLPDTEWVAIEEDLAPGALVIVNKAMSVADGDRVEPVRMQGDDRAPDAMAGERSAEPAS